MNKRNTFIFYKPYDVLSQFTKEVAEHKVIGDYYNFPPDVYPIGRLDKDSEGLLLLSNDKKLVAQLLSPLQEKPKTYKVQLDGTITYEAIETLSKGVVIKLPNKQSYKTRPCEVRKIKTPKFPERDPPIRVRANIPTSWIEMTLHEGKNRQIRKMCSQVGFPVLRLIRTEVAGYTIIGLKPGEVKQV